MSNRTSPIGALVRLYVDLERQVNTGDVIETRTGRGYLVLGVRIQARGKHAGRQHLQCSVMGTDWLAAGLASAPDGAYVHRIRWYRRKRGAGVVCR